MNRLFPAVLSLLVVSALAVFASGPPVAYSGDTGCNITVNSTADEVDDSDSEVTLTEAIIFAIGLDDPGIGEAGQLLCVGIGPGANVTDTILFDDTVFDPENPATITLVADLPPLLSGGDVIFGNEAGVIIDGDGTDNCLTVNSSFNVISGLHIRNCTKGILVAGIVVPVGGALPQGGPQADENLIAGNTIEGNTTGISLEESSTGRNVIAGNLIGTGGDEALQPNQTGVRVDQSTDTHIGPLLMTPVSPAGVPEAGEGNVISGNDGAGISLIGAHGSIVQGNLIGTDVSGLVAVPNSVGVDVSGSLFVDIGGSGEGEGNVISGNENWAIRLFGSGTADTRVVGNYIGTDVTGNAPLGNERYGIIVVNTDDNQIGGAGEGEGNVISGNGIDGLVFNGNPSSNEVYGNLIGVGADGQTPVGNGSAGVKSYGVGASNVVGGEGPAQNVIAHNGTDGIAMVLSIIPRLSQPQGGPVPQLAINPNSIHSNLGLGIDLDGDGVDFNDDQDFDHRSNLGQNYPILTFAETNGMTHIEGTLNSMPNTGFLLRFFANDECDPSDYGEGQTYLGSKVVNTDPDGNVAFDADVSPAQGGQFITATATDAPGNTSEFSECIPVQGGETPTPTPSPTPSPTPTPTPSPTPVPGILGDTDCDLDVDAVDALHVLQDAAGFEPAVACLPQGDVQCDMDLDAVDALGILAHVAGLPPQPQEEGCPAIGDPIV